MLARRDFMQVRLQHDCRCLVQFVNDAALMYDALGFNSLDDMIHQGFGLKPADIGIAVEWLRLNPSDSPIELKTAIQLGKWGRPKKGEEKGRIATLSSRGRAYILARLDRDRPDLAARVRAHELSANAAAIEAGFRKKPKRRCPECGHEW
jgi:hypothetical protein